MGLVQVNPYTTLANFDKGAIHEKNRVYLTIISCFALGASLAHADSREPSGKMHEHGDQMPGQMHGDMKEKMFKEMDTNGDGAISEAEFNAFHAKRFKEMDANGDGKISHDEMEAGHKKMMEKGKGKRFDEADTNHDGALTREEAKKMPMLSKHFDEVDTNKDGKVTREEMDAAMEKRRHDHDAKEHSHDDMKQGGY